MLWWSVVVVQVVAILSVVVAVERVVYGAVRARQ
jgi:hypothetical protein